MSASGDDSDEIPAAPIASRRLVHAMVAIFALATAAAVIGGWLVTADVRQRARAMDATLRRTAWELLCYRDAQGRFPVSVEEFDRERAAKDTCEALTQTIVGVPSERTQTANPDATAEVFSNATRTRAETSLVISWPAASEAEQHPPVLGSSGEPSLHGTLEQVNAWLKAALVAR